MSAGTLPVLGRCPRVLRDIHTVRTYIGHRTFREFIYYRFNVGRGRIPPPHINQSCLFGFYYLLFKIEVGDFDNIGTPSANFIKCSIMLMPLPPAVKAFFNDFSAIFLAFSLRNTSHFPASQHGKKNGEKKGAEF